MSHHHVTSPLIRGALSVTLLGTSVCQAADDTISRNALRQAYYGETHMHTAYSLDAFIGGTRQTPDDAYRAAKGEAVVVNGQPHAIRRPLDFAAVTDHAEYLGEMYTTLVAGAPGHDQDLIVQLRGLRSNEEREAWFFKYVISNNRGAKPQHPAFFAGEDTIKSAWQIAIDAAKAHYQPGKFTTLAAFEWSAAPGGANLHRNILFRGLKLPAMPVSYIDINREEGLWDWMASLEKQGMKALAIPHNSNASKKMMFADNDSTGKALDVEYAQLRSHFEPLIEIMQIKGNSEVHRNFWAADEFADFENADSLANYSDRKIAKQNYVRHAVVKGLAHDKALGSNPYKLGFVGGTDNHNGMMSDVDEDTFVGGHGPMDGSVESRRTGEVGSWIAGKDINPGALTGVWAQSNTRADIWDAMMARETFATSGPRIAVRLFAGWTFADNLHTSSNAIERAYKEGVAMGSDLKAGKPGTAPKFLVIASKDPLGANLDRVQIVKGWVDAKGELHDKVFDVVWSDERALDKDGTLAVVGNTVDLATATYRNTIGDGQLATVWTDPEFDAGQPALYYARVLEIPTPRWSTFDAVRAGLPLDQDAAATIQERAWSSPIWFKP